MTLEMKGNVEMIGAGAGIEMTIGRSPKNIVNVKRRVKKRNIKRSQRNQKTTRKTVSQRRAEKASNIPPH